MSKSKKDGAMTEWHRDYARSAAVRHQEQMAKVAQQARVFRREKCTPARDFWHTLAVGAPIAVVLLIVLPFIFGIWE